MPNLRGKMEEEDSTVRGKEEGNKQENQFLLTPRRYRKGRVCYVFRGGVGKEGNVSMLIHEIRGKTKEELESMEALGGKVPKK